MAADESSELDEIVQVGPWHRAATSHTESSFPQLATNNPLAEPHKTTADNQNKTNSSFSSASGGGGGGGGGGNQNNNQTLDESTNNGFTTAPATSDDDFDSDDDDDSRSMCSNKDTSSNSGNVAGGNVAHSSSGATGQANGAARYSKYGANGRYAIKGEQKRSHHNVLERKRRDLLKDSFAALRESVPMNHSKERVSRAEILKQAADFIQSTVKRNASVREELEELIRKNRQFEQEQQAKQSPVASVAIASESTDSSLPIADSSGADTSKLLAPVEVAIKQEH